MRRSVVLGCCWLLAWGLCGCHTSMCRPIPPLQHVENGCGDMVDHVGLMTSISNPKINRCVNRMCDKVHD
jgi:hypothetical protein